jgi:hypothetical protein
MTLQEWREHGAEIHYSWWKFGWTLKPIEPSGSNQKTQKSNKPAQRAK